MVKSASPDKFRETAQRHDANLMSCRAQSQAERDIRLHVSAGSDG
jgi:hypothetical protein